MSGHHSPPNTNTTSTADTALLQTVTSALALHAGHTTTTPSHPHTTHQPPSYGAALRPLFTLRKDNRSINFGSFGATPVAIAAHKVLLAAQQNEDPDMALRFVCKERLVAVRRQLAQYLNTIIDDGLEENKGQDGSVVGCICPSEIFLTENAADAMNVVARSLFLNPQCPVSTPHMFGAPAAVAYPPALGEALERDHSSHHNSHNKKKGEDKEEQTGDSTSKSIGARVVHVEEGPESSDKEKDKDNNNNNENTENDNSTKPLPGGAVLRTASLGARTRYCLHRTIISFENQYPMVKKVLEHGAALLLGGGGEAVNMTGSTGALPAVQPAPDQLTVDLKVVTLTQEMLSEESKFIDAVVAAVEEAYEDYSRTASQRVHQVVLIMDHVCWAPAVIFPVRTVAAKVKAMYPQTMVVVDGAHSIGMVSLARLLAPMTPAEREAGGLGACGEGVPPIDAFFSNCHKWLMAPRQSAVLVVPAHYHPYLHPSIISNFYRGLVNPILSSPRPGPLGVSAESWAQDEFFWSGTRDLSDYMLLPELLRYRSTVLGGESSIMKHNRQLAYTGAATIAQIWGTEVLVKDGNRLGSMACVRVPPAVATSAELTGQISRVLLQQYNTFAPPVTFCGVQYIRAAAQVYNSKEDYVYYAESFLKAMKEVLEQQKK